jgi:6-pyruvoyl-tetrahydropterin synthase
MADRELFEVRVEVEFRAAHSVAPDGTPADRHHHRWQVAVRARSESLDDIAIVVDFRRLRDDALELVSQLEGTVLEDNPALAEVPPTAPGVAEWLFERLSKDAEGADYRIEAVEVECDEGIRWVTGSATAAARHPV